MVSGSCLVWNTAILLWATLVLRISLPLLREMNSLQGSRALHCSCTHLQNEPSCLCKPANVYMLCFTCAAVYNSTYANVCMNSDEQCGIMQGCRIVVGPLLFYQRAHGAPCANQVLPLTTHKGHIIPSILPAISLMMPDVKHGKTIKSMDHRGSCLILSKGKMNPKDRKLDNTAWG